MATPAVTCGNCGRSVAVSETVNLAGVTICAQCKPAYIRRLQEGAAPTRVALRYQGFWIRFVAKFIDGLVLSVVTTPLYFLMLLPAIRSQVAAQGTGADPAAAAAAMFGAMGLMYGVSFGLSLAYNTIMNGRWGATLGKMAIGARIVNADGTPIGYGKALARFLAEIVSSLILAIGYIMAAFDSKKRALHDHICGTVVVAK
jgi:uncharacterized RDD family membrane protein YckC